MKSKNTVVIGALLLIVVYPSGRTLRGDGTPLSKVFSIGNVVALPGFMIWMVATGITVWRLPKSVAT